MAPGPGHEIALLVEPKRSDRNVLGCPSSRLLGERRGCSVADRAQLRRSTRPGPALGDRLGQGVERNHEAKPRVRSAAIDRVGCRPEGPREPPQFIRSILADSAEHERTKRLAADTENIKLQCIPKEPLPRRRRSRPAENSNYNITSLGCAQQLLHVRDLRHESLFPLVEVRVSSGRLGESFDGRHRRAKEGDGEGQPHPSSFVANRDGLGDGSKRTPMPDPPVAAPLVNAHPGAGLRTAEAHRRKSPAPSPWCQHT